MRKQLKTIKQDTLAEYQNDFNRIKRHFLQELEVYLNQNNVQEELITTIQQKDTLLDQAIQERNSMDR